MLARNSDAMPMARNSEIEPGMAFGLLKVVRYDFNEKRGRWQWLCSCACGSDKHVDAYKLRIGQTRSCGCKAREMARDAIRAHGHGSPQKTPTYRSWQHMLDRCYREKSDSYSNYGGRGIKVCDEWHDFSAFLADMGERPSGMSIDRIDGSKGYSKENCRWATQAQQSQNTSRCKLNAESVREIRALHGTVSARALARRYEVTHSRISAIWRGEAWRTE